MTNARKKLALGFVLVLLAVGATYAWSSLPRWANWAKAIT
jgi:hypothetical protein